VLDTYVYHYKFALRVTLYSFTYLFTIQMSLFIGFRINTNQVILFRGISVNFDVLLVPKLYIYIYIPLLDLISDDACFNVT
jgi:hypothetical protein